MPGMAKFTPTIEDHVAGQRLWLASYLRRPVMKWLLALMLLLLFIVIASMFTETVLNRGSGLSIDGLIGPIAAPVIFLGLQLLAWLRVPSLVRRMSRQQPMLLSETTWKWDEEGLIASSAAGSSIVRWSELHRWLENSTSIVLLPQERLLLILPKRFLRNDEAGNLTRMLTQFAGNENGS